MLSVEDRPIPEPTGSDVLVAVISAGLCGSDLRLGRDGVRGGRTAEGPILLGHEVVGTVVRHGPLAGGWPAPGTRVAAL
ncbi:MAG: alcohol dehydrogenase catalytic domain-containing protein, partial [Micromonosporaceae bacterium]